MIDERDPVSADPALDMFNPDNGPPFKPDFVAAYRDAQVARNNKISAWCREEIARLARHDIWDTVFVLNRVWADLRFTDLALGPSERKGGCYGGDPMRANYGPFGLWLANSCRSWLCMCRHGDCDVRAEGHLGPLTQHCLLV